jgi:2-haloacid dehalogenase
MATGKNIVFDVVGTLACYDELYNGIDARLGDKLRAQGIKSSLLGYTWIEVAEREYTYLSMAGAYKSFDTVFEAVFYRVLFSAGIQDPKAFASAEDLAFVMEANSRMKLRDGAVECITILRDAGFTVWAMTAADKERVRGYFANAGLDLPTENLLSSDDTGIGKPALDGYVPLYEQLAKEGKPWFAAAHKWDVSAAHRVGYVAAQPFGCCDDDLVLTILKIPWGILYNSRA